MIIQIFRNFYQTDSTSNIILYIYFQCVYSIDYFIFIDYFLVDINLFIN